MCSERTGIAIPMVAVLIAVKDDTEFMDVQNSYNIELISGTLKLS